ncbi:probable transcription factor At1g11510 [Salvia hispanica]|uniref:probable transcription factor At1g11510 n=1 Tax=Salvia hispanica TaxID=49212 RepID=UPI0020094531|nr:probable transcription factor At1g11510 [Salvia hispanica]
MSDSSEEDDEVAPEEESDSGLELQQTQSAMARPLLPSSSSEEEESETELDSDADLMQRPLAAKPVVETQVKPVDDSKLRFTLVRINKATNSADVAAADVVDVKNTLDAAADVVAAEVKNTPRKSAEPETSDRKSNPFQRIWSEDDEIVILNGMINYLAKFKTDPTKDINMFHSFIKEDLQADCSRTQLIDKIRRMRNKFDKKIKNGKEITFSKPHEQTVYDLSKTIWGNKEKPIVVISGAVRRSANKKESEEVVPKKRMRVNSNYRGAMTMEEKMLMNGEDLFESGQGLKGEKEWKKLRVEEVQNYLKHLELKVAQIKLVLAAMMKHS